jgi:hypothetical protein
MIKFEKNLIGNFFYQNRHEPVFLNPYRLLKHENLHFFFFGVPLQFWLDPKPLTQLNPDSDHWFVVKAVVVYNIHANIQTFDFVSKFIDFLLKKMNFSVFRMRIRLDTYDLAHESVQNAFAPTVPKYLLER